MSNILEIIVDSKYPTADDHNIFDHNCDCASGVIASGMMLECFSQTLFSL